MSLIEHLETGVTTVARAWSLRRADGLIMGFTDHDRDLSFDGVIFQGGTGLTAHAIEQSTGLSVDNSEAMGALSSAGITEADIEAGLYDGAEVEMWMVNWADVDQRRSVFFGTFGEMSRGGGAFRVELRGLAETLNQPQGRVFQGLCPATLGDGACRADLSTTSTQGAIAAVEKGLTLLFRTLPDASDRWFEAGRIEVLTGDAAGRIATIKNDRQRTTGREIELWEPMDDLASGDQVRLIPGCDKRFATCGAKFANAQNFRGFPHMPGEDWLISYPVQGGNHDGGRL